VARARSPDRDKAFEMWRDSGGTMKLKDIADALGVSDTQIRKWKNQDKWNDRLKGNVTIPKSNVTKRRPGAPKGNKNAVGNAGGAAPKGNSNAVTHGFFRRIFPDDEETHAIIGEIGVKSPLDILWENIVIQYTAIARAQKIMFVRDQQDETKVLKKFKPGMFGDEKEWELQHAWDKHATFLQAQSRAMATLQGLIKRYEEMLVTALATEEQRLRVEKLKLEIGKLQGSSAEDKGIVIQIDYGDGGE
jgi:phage terminase small subunit